MTTVEQGLTGRALGEAVIDHVLTFPEQHDQSSTADDLDAYGSIVHDEDTSTPRCGSTCCIAGWAIALHHGVRGRKAIWNLSYDAGRPSEDIAAELLGIDALAFGDAVFRQLDPDTAIANFKHLLDETYSERAS